MAKGARSIAALAGLVDAVIEVRDARVPRSTAVTGLVPRLAGKPRFVVLNRADLADARATAQWLEALRLEGDRTFAAQATRAASLRELRAALVRSRPRRGRTRVAVIGAPNVGKSSVINALAHRRRAVTQNKPGVTRAVQWLRVAESVELLDTPGVLAPRIADEQAAWQLALCGSLPDDVFDAEEVAVAFAAWVAAHRGERAAQLELDKFAARHGMKRRGGELDRLGAARKLIARFRAGSLGRFTFERPHETD